MTEKELTFWGIFEDFKKELSQAKKELQEKDRVMQQLIEKDHGPCKVIAEEKDKEIRHLTAMAMKNEREFAELVELRKASTTIRKYFDDNSTIAKELQEWKQWAEKLSHALSTVYMTDTTAVLSDFQKFKESQGNKEKP